MNYLVRGREIMNKSKAKETLLGIQLHPEIEAYLYDTNPWWKGKPMRPLPSFRRFIFEQLIQRLKTGLAPVIVLRGPRQVGKTTLQGHIIEYLLNGERVKPQRIFRVQFDDLPSLKGLQDPILSLCRWFESRISGETFNEQARKGEPVFLFFDEMQNLTDWAPQVKALVDHHSVCVLLTGSSALRIEYGRDSLAGRISTMDLGTLLLREIAALRGWGDIPALLPVNGLGRLKERGFWEEAQRRGIEYASLRDRSFNAFSKYGGYPIAQARADRPWEEIADQLNETIIKRVIQHDLRLGERGRRRDQNLLEEIFRLCCRYGGQAPGQALFVRELQLALTANVGSQRVLAYLRFLNDTLLIRLIHPLELRLKKRKGFPKICLCDHSLRASWLQERIPITKEELRVSPHLSGLAGHLAESIVGYFLGTIAALDIAWFPGRGIEPEVDFVITIGEHRIPVEIKYTQKIDPLRDTLGLRSFLEKSVYNAPFGLLVTIMDDFAAQDPRIITISLPSLLLIK